MTFSASNFEFLLTLSDPEEIEEARKLIKASLNVFLAMNAPELPTSKLIEGLQRRNRIKISAERFEKLIGGCGIRQLKKNDANYYCNLDFVLALASLPKHHRSRLHRAKRETVEAVEGVERRRTPAHQIANPFGIGASRRTWRPRSAHLSSSPSSVQRIYTQQFFALRAALGPRLPACRS
jgi:hypothetical protein